MAADDHTAKKRWIRQHTTSDTDVSSSSKNEDSHIPTPSGFAGSGIFTPSLTPNDSPLLSFERHQSPPPYSPADILPKQFDENAVKSFVNRNALPSSSFHPSSINISINNYIGLTHLHHHHDSSKSFSKNTPLSKVHLTHNIEKSSLQTINSFAGLRITQHSLKPIFIALAWYLSSALTSTSTKSILSHFPFPTTLTLLQFMFVALYCVLWSQVPKWLSKVGQSRIRGVNLVWTKDVGIVIPVSLCQILGHLFSCSAMGRVSVGFVHTVKSLSPLFTVVLYHLYFHQRFSVKTYTSLIPLTLGVILACSYEVKFDSVGLLLALLSTFIFVIQNVVSKRFVFEKGHGYSHSHQDEEEVTLETSTRRPRKNSDPLPPTPLLGHVQSTSSKRKLDKINVLFYTSLFAFTIMFPFWMYTDLPSIISSSTSLPFSSFLLNSTLHFLQTIFAFSLLSLISPVTYSIASLLKRITVIVFSVIWFGHDVSFLQVVGVSMAMGGVWLYNKAKMEEGKGKGRRGSH